MKIDSNIPLPPEDEAPAAEPTKRKPRARKQAAAGKNKAKGPSPAASLLAALKFVAIAQKKAGPTNVQFGHIAHNWAAASDGVLTVAHPIEEDLVACPHTLQFIDALSKVGEELSITRSLPRTPLAVSSGAFRALVPCVGFDDVPITAPDPQCATIDDRIKTAFAAGRRACDRRRTECDLCRRLAASRKRRRDQRGGLAGSVARCRPSARHDASEVRGGRCRQGWPGPYRLRLFGVVGNVLFRKRGVYQNATLRRTLPELPSCLRS
ncbi:DNA polymerase processivity factor [Pseudomonas phage PSA-KC1]